MRKIKWAADYLKEADIVIKDPSTKKGKWKSFLHCRTLHVEAGCGKGNYSLEMSRMDPQCGFVAVEKNESAAGLAARRFENSEHGENLALVHGDAALLQEWFDRGEIDVIHLNFSDPWPKKRYAKRRLSSPAFLFQYKDLLAPGGQIRMKTDNADLFAYSLMQFQEAGFRMQEVDLNYRSQPHPEDAYTEYESKFVEKGHPIYRAVWTAEENKEETT